MTFKNLLYEVNLCNGLKLEHRCCKMFYNVHPFSILAMIKSNFLLSVSIIYFYTSFHKIVKLECKYKIRKKRKKQWWLAVFTPSPFLTDLHVLRCHEHHFTIFTKCLSVGLSVYVWHKFCGCARATINGRIAWNFVFSCILI